MTKAQDPVVEANRQALLERSNLGIAKYGQMLNRPDLGLRDWLQHALEETLDQANYLQAAIHHLDLQEKRPMEPTVPATTPVADLVVTPDDYQRLACRTAPPGEKPLAALVHCALGITTEAGEYATEVKRAHIYGKPMTDEMRAHMIEELGDTMWYVAYACAALDVKLGTVLQQNIDKLRKRFPEKFTQEAAEARADKGGLDARSS